MPAGFDACCSALKAAGVDSGKACRACRVAFWQQAGMTPEAADRSGADCPEPLAASAQVIAANLSDRGRDGARVAYTHPQTLRGVSVLEDVTRPPKGATIMSSPLHQALAANDARLRTLELQ